MAEIIALVDHDDEDWLRVIDLLRERGHEVPTLVLGIPDEQMDLHLTLDDFTLRQGEAVLDAAAFRWARVVIFQRWRMANVPLVLSTLIDPTERAFAQREWDSALTAT